jgi:sec-independent protein translocase protein TatA
MHIGAPEIIIILVLFFLLFGAKKLPDAAGSLAKSLKIFKNEMHSVSEDFQDEATNRQEKDEDTDRTSET